MKKKIILSIIVILLMVGVFFIGRQVGLNNESGKTTTVTRNEAVSKQEIKQTLSASGYATAKTSENLSLSTSKYFSALCVEVNDTVSEGENILEYSDGTYLTAPYDLVVTSTNLPDTGSKATSSNYVAVSGTKDLTATISINESDINNIKVSQEVSISLTSDSTKTYTGTISKVNEVGTYQSSGTTFTATVEFENDGNVKLGMGLSCTITIGDEQDALCVPIDAVKENSEGKDYVVKVNDDGTTEETIVETGLANDNYVQITSGLSEGDKVQITTKITEDSSTSSSSSNSKQNKGGDFSGGPQQGGGDMPSGDMMQGGQGGGPMGQQQSSSN